jgi:transcriptional repressor of dcmA and dcmR
MTAPSELLDIKQAAHLLHVSETSLRRWTNAGQLACLRVGRRRERRFRRSDLLAFMEHQPADVAARAVSAGARHQAVIGGIPLTFGTHLCAFYESNAGRARLAVAFLADGLHPGSVCYLVASPEHQPQVLGQLENGHGSLDPELEAGRLVIAKYHSTAREQCQYWETKFVSAMRGGADSLRLVGDMTLCLDAGMCLDEVLKYEALYDRLIARRFPVVTLCLYDVRRFQSLEVVGALKGHADAFRYPVERLFA